MLSVQTAGFSDLPLDESRHSIVQDMMKQLLVCTDSSTIFLYWLFVALINFCMKYHIFIYMVCLTY